MHRADRYYGAAADDYERKRDASRKWQKEQRQVRDHLKLVPVGSSCLDVPVGTGRFFACYAERGFDVVGVDVSEDMLARAQHSAEGTDLPARMLRGTILQLPFRDGQFDVIVCFRLLNWMSGDDVRVVMRELARLARMWVLISIRYELAFREGEAGVSVLATVVARTGRYLKRLGRRVLRQPTTIRHDRATLVSAIAAAGLELVAEDLLDEAPGTSRYVTWKLRRHLRG